MPVTVIHTLSYTHYAHTEYQHTLSCTHCHIHTVIHTLNVSNKHCHTHTKRVIQTLSYTH
jgi:hypothetical protein